MDAAFLFQIGDSQSSLAITDWYIPADEGRIAGMKDEALGGTSVYRYIAYDDITVSGIDDAFIGIFTIIYFRMIYHAICLV